MEVARMEVTQRNIGFWDSLKEACSSLWNWLRGRTVVESIVGGVATAVGAMVGGM